MNACLAGAGVITAGGVLSLLFPQKFKSWIASFLAFAGAGIAALGAVSALLQPGQEAGLFGVDALTAVFVLIICFAGPLAVLYSASYMRMYTEAGRSVTSHYVFLPVLVSSMIFVVCSRDAVAFLFSWEVMALSSFFLVAFDNVKKDVFDASIYYLVMSHISAALIMAGFILSAGNGFSFAAVKQYLAQGGAPAIAAFLLLFLGFGVKAGLAPLHTWLPAAHPAAPSHISGLMSGVMIKMGIYGILRTLTLAPVMPAWTGYGVLAIGLLTALLGALYTLTQGDYKRVLAYSSVENIGIMTAGIGLGMLGMSTSRPLMAVLGFAGAILHAANHSVFKTMLFFGSGAIYAATHTRDLEHLGGLSKKMPWLSSAYLAGTAAISGLPLFNGFVSELLIYLAMAQAVMSKAPLLAAAGVLSLAALSLTGAMALYGFVRLYSCAFSGPARSARAEIEPGSDRLASGIMTVMAAVCLALGLMPQAGLDLVLGPVSVVTGAPADAGFAHGLFMKLSVIFTCTAAVIAAVSLLRAFAMRKRSAQATTWGCGYRAPNPRMQYTAYAFAEPFVKTAEPFVAKQKEEIKPAGIYPQAGSYRAQFSDMLEKYAVKPAGDRTAWFLKLFSWIQSGNTRDYILYGVLFLLASVIWAVLS